MEYKNASHKRLLCQLSITHTHFNPVMVGKVITQHAASDEEGERGPSCHPPA